MRSKVLFYLAFLFVTNLSFAQPYKTIKRYKPYKWMIGLHWAAIDDDGNQFGDLFNMKDSWMYSYYPTQLSVDRYFDNGWSIEGVATYMQYVPDKNVNDTILHQYATFANLDINGKYSFYIDYAPKARWIEPYITFGLGYTFRDSAFVAQHVPSVNLGAGLNFWFTKNIGIRFHSSAKIGVFPGFWTTHTNYLHHNVGLLIRWNEGKKEDNSFQKRKHKWTRKHGGRRKKGGH